MAITAQRILDMPPYMFAEIDRVKRRMREEGAKLLDFGIGDPDMPTPPFIVEKLCEAVRDPKNHRYPQYAGMREFRAAAADWCSRRHGFTADPDTEVLTLIGSKEGIAHVPLAALNPGDLALVTDPGYPVYVTAVSPGIDGILPREHATKRGQFTVGWKMLSADMAGDDKGKDWLVDEVPFVAYYKGNYALHGAFWHDDFGRPKSHGCVNLAPADAQFLFRWMDPVLPEGWYAAAAYHPYVKGTAIDVQP